MNRAEQPQSTNAPQRPSAFRALLSSRMMWLAMVVSVIGGTMWAYGAMTRSAKTSGASSTPGMALVQSDSGGGGGEATAAEPGFTEKAGKWLIKLGPSFIAGFLIGWGIRRFFKWTLLLVAIVGVGLYLLKRAGVFDVNYDEIKGSVDQGVEWAKEHVTEAKDWALKYVPSGTTAVVGMFFGARR